MELKNSCALCEETKIGGIGLKSIFWISNGTKILLEVNDLAGG